MLSEEIETDANKTAATLNAIVDQLLGRVVGADGVIAESHRNATVLARQAFRDAEARITAALKVRPQKPRPEVTPSPSVKFLEKYGPIVARVRAGETASSVARDVGLSSSRIGQILEKYRWSEMRIASGDPLVALSVRARNCLCAEGLDSVEKIRQVLARGELKKIPNIGPKIVAEIENFIEGRP